MFEFSTPIKGGDSEFDMFSTMAFDSPAAGGNFLGSKTESLMSPMQTPRATPEMSPVQTHYQSDLSFGSPAFPLKNPIQASPGTFSLPTQQDSDMSFESPAFSLTKSLPGTGFEISPLQPIHHDSDMSFESPGFSLNRNSIPGISPLQSIQNQAVDLSFESPSFPLKKPLQGSPDMFSMGFDSPAVSGFLRPGPTKSMMMSPMQSEPKSLDFSSSSLKEADGDFDMFSNSLGSETPKPKSKKVASPPLEDDRPFKR